MKRLFLTMALPIALSALSFEANARDQKSSASKATPAPTPSGLDAEMKYARDMAKTVHDEIALYGSNRSIRSQIKKVDDGIAHVNQEISTRKYDRDKIHQEVALIDDQLHSIDLQLRDLSAHQPMSLTGGKMSLLR